MHTTGGDAAEAKDTPMAAAADPHSEGGAPGDQGASPQKRGRVNEQPLTIAMLREVLAQERELDRAHLVESLESVKGDVRAIQNRVDSVEQGVTAQMEKTLKMLDKITDNYSSQAKALEELKDTQRPWSLSLSSPRHRGARRTQSGEGGSLQPSFWEVGTRTRPLRIP